MKSKLLHLFAALWLVCTATSLSAQEAIRIACVGNSITFGAGIANREKNCYPAQLQAYLGAQYEVKNFGVSARTTFTKGDNPYIKTKAYEESLAYQPNIVLIKMGTNDSKPQNWKHKAEFKTDYQHLVESYLKLDSHPRIILMTPIKSFLPAGSAIADSIIGGEIRSMIETIAYENGLEIINLYNLFGNKWEQSLMPDKLHPSSIGAGQMAKKINNYLTHAKLDESNLPEKLGAKDAKTFNFHGYQGYTFANEGTPCKIVKPHTEAEGKPWVIRARFWGHEPQTDIDLLENGFHVMYCDVADLFGSDKAIARWDSFYKRMRKAGFHQKVVLEGMSRGGLIVYNWAARNPKKVACIYADAPVMDFKSWPLGKGKSTKDEAPVKSLLSAYGFANETEALNWKRNPVDCAAIIAKAGIPVLHVVGDADDVVPVAENTALFEAALRQLGHPITVIHKPGIGHHPHSLANPAPIVRFILAATGRGINSCVQAVPGNEYRSGAGWKEGADWHQVAEDISATLEGKQLKLLLLGNSITQGWGGNRKLVTGKPGREAMNAVMGEDTWESAGISGDRTENLLWRLRNGNYNSCHPQYAVIAIGINNLLSAKDTPEEVTEGIIAVAKEARMQLPNTHIILLGLLPSGKLKDSDIRKKCDKIHSILAQTSIKGVEYINPTAWFTQADGTMKEGLYGNDYIHLTTKGYQVWAAEIAKRLTP